MTEGKRPDADKEEDADRTLFLPSSGGEEGAAQGPPEGASEGPPERPAEAGAEDDDRTQFLPQPGPPGQSVPDPQHPPQGGGAPYAEADGDVTRPPEPEAQDWSQPPAEPPQDWSQPAGAQPQEWSQPPAGQPQDWSQPPPGQPQEWSQPPQTGAPVPPVAPPGWRGPPPTVQVGTVINNNYRVEEVLKAGGMGEVYRGVEVGTGDPVAIKAILPELAEDESAGLMFTREAKTLRQLTDEAIVRYYNYVHDPALGRYFLIMEFISGVPLSEFAASCGGISAADAKILLERLARGLSKAHEREVIHRDLSPDNVMLPEEIIASAILIDFGIAKSNVVKEGTMAGRFAGKFKYVAPEQLGHFGGTITPKTDIYGLALLMAAALCGRPLDMGASIVEAVESRQSIPDLSSIDTTLRPLLAHMLEPDPADRPASMAEVLRLLDDPALIPETYYGELPRPMPKHFGARAPLPGQTAAMSARTMSPVTVGGFQQPPTFGGGTTSAGTDLPASRKGGGAGALIALLILALIGGGGWYALRAGWLPWSMDDIMALIETPSAPLEPAAPTAEADPMEAFLAGAVAGDCAFATGHPGGPFAGEIGLFSTTPGANDALPGAFVSALGGGPPRLSDTLVAAPQCPALALARALQVNGAPPVYLDLALEPKPGTFAISGSVIGSGDRVVWLALVNHSGQIYNLTPALAPAQADARAFSFELRAATGSDPLPQMVLAIASPEPLVRTAAARDGVAAADLLPLVERELAKGGGGAVALEVFDLAGGG